MPVKRADDIAAAQQLLLLATGNLLRIKKQSLIKQDQVPFGTANVWPRQDHNVAKQPWCNHLFQPL